MWFHNSNLGHKCGLTIPHVRDLHKVLTSTNVVFHAVKNFSKICSSDVREIFCNYKEMTKTTVTPFLAFGQYCQVPSPIWMISTECWPQKSEVLVSVHVSVSCALLQDQPYSISISKHPSLAWSPQHADLKSRKWWCLCTCLSHILKSALLEVIWWYLLNLIFAAILIIFKIFEDILYIWCAICYDLWS